MDARIITYDFSENIIEKAAEWIDLNVVRKGVDLSRVACVFGGKRPALFLQRALARRMRRGYVPPRSFAMDAFMEYAVSKRRMYTPIRSTDAYYQVYRIAREHMPQVLEGRESFARFLPWAREILRFIELLDLEDIGSDVLENIESAASIGYDVPESINALLKHVILLRERYHEMLASGGMISRGLEYRLAARDIGRTAFDEFEVILFMDLFFMHRTEQTVLKTLFDRGQAVLMFQGDEKDWTVLRDNARVFGHPIWPERKHTREPSVSFHRGFDTHSQVGIVRELLKDLDSPDDTAVVLPDTSSLVPLLSQISPVVEDCNVSMGYPMRRSSLYVLFSTIFQAQSTRRDGTYYVRDYLSVLRHPLIKNLRMLEDAAVTRVLIHSIEEVLAGQEQSAVSGELFVRLIDIEQSPEIAYRTRQTLSGMGLTAESGQLRRMMTYIHMIAFGEWEVCHSFRDFTAALGRFLDLLVERSPLEKYPLNLKIADRLFALRDELDSAVFAAEAFARRELFNVFMRLLENEQVAFAGSPLKGLQVLGLLETRALDFETVIVMDVNESVLPDVTVYEKLIPREVMLILGLDRLEKEEEIQRYWFKRLIGGARQVHLVYEESRDRQKSRFIESLIWERQKAEGRFNVVSVPHAHFPVNIMKGRVVVAKTPAMVEFLKGMTYSASSINIWLECPLRFYYQYVLGLREAEDVFEEPESRDIGDFVHNLLEETYMPFLGKRPVIDEAFIAGFMDLFDLRFRERVERRMRADAFMVKEIMQVRLRRFLEKEASRPVDSIEALEREFRGTLHCREHVFHVMARVDRIDRLYGGELMVLDYKTGSEDIKPRISRIATLTGDEDRRQLRSSVRSFQLPLYLHVIAQTYPDVPMNAALYNLRTLEISPLFTEKEEGQKERVTALLLQALETVMCDIVDPAVPFEADGADPRHCAFCPFTDMCR